MALYVKQDFTPPILSRKWIAMKFRPNMQIYTRDNIISILESGLLFREDSIEVEQEIPSAEIYSSGGVWLTRGERVAAGFAVGAAVCLLPPRAINRSLLFHLALYLSLPVAIRLTHRLACRGSLPALLARMRDYLTLARRAAACLRECTALRAELGSVSSVLESTKTMLCRQQSELSVTLSRASSAVLGNAPWLRGDVAWDAMVQQDPDNLMKIHHAFLVVQSTLLKHIALAHFIPTPNAKRLYRNHNERIYWLHNVLITHLTEEFQQNYEALERMYRLLKNYGNADSTVSKKPGTAINDSWLYTDVHSDIARANLELKTALNKCTNLDLFLDSCALNQQELDLNALNKDIDNLINHLTKCLTTTQSSQIRLKKIMSKFKVDQPKEFEEDLIENEREILKIEDREPEVKDEVFYFVKTEDDLAFIQPSGDVTTGPGKKEKEATKIVLTELKRKLIGREDLMRERERQALAKTMPELRNNVPEFPRQIDIECTNKKGFISKLPKRTPKRRLFKTYLIQTLSASKTKNGYKLQKQKYKTETDIKSPLYEANSKLNAKSKLLTFSLLKNHTYITEWHKKPANFDSELSEKGAKIDSDLSGLSDVEGGAINKTINQAVNVDNNFKDTGDAINFRFTKQDLELSPSSSESESDFEMSKQKHMALLKDMRRDRAKWRKNHPDKRASTSSIDKADESMRPLEYSFGAGLAMASVLQVNSAARLPNMAREEVFVGDGEVSQDSGNDEDA